MSPHGSSRRHHICHSQRTNKLSLKTLKPLQEEKQVSDFQREDGEILDASNYSRILSQRSKNGLLGFKTIYEHCSSDLTDVVDVHESQHLEGSKATVESVVICDNTVSDRVHNQRNSTEESSRRGSIFTDIEDGSFIEFFHGKEKGQPVPKLKKKQDVCTPQLYYTCESQNETHHSTSTKKDSALVGFRKYVETVRRQKGLQNIIKGSKMEMLKMPKIAKNFDFDETIITCSADMQKYQAKAHEKIVINSTMIEHVPCQVHVPFPQVFSDISTLTEQNEVSSSEFINPTPVMSPDYLHRKSCKKVHQLIVISESSDDESSQVVRALNENKDDAGVIRLGNQEGDNSNYRKERVGENHATSQPQAGVGSQELLTSVTSEDVSIVSSFAPTRHQLLKPEGSTEANPVGLVSSDSEKKVVHSAVKECTEEARLVYDLDCNANNDLDYDADCEEYKAVTAGTPEKPRVVMPENAKSPTVAKWIISSPFKDSSFGSSFLQRNDSSGISESPSQPKAPGYSKHNGPSKISDHRLWRDIKKSKKMSYSVSKAKNSPRSLHSSSSSSSDSSYSESYLKIKKYNSCRVVESSSEESDDVSGRIFKSHLKQDSDSKRSLNSTKRYCTNDLSEKSYEMSFDLQRSEDMKRTRNSLKSDNADKSSDRSQEESLHLRLSDELGKSKTSEKTIFTIGRDATSPSTLRKSLASDSDCDTLRNPRLNRIISDSGSHDCNDDDDKDKIMSSSSSMDASLPENEAHANEHARTLGKQTTSSALLRHTENLHASDGASKDVLDLRQIQEELDKVYSSEWRKNESSVLKNVTSENRGSVMGKQSVEDTVNYKIHNTGQPIGRVKEKTQRRLCFESDEEEEKEEDSLHPQVRETTSEEDDNDDLPNMHMRKGNAQIDESYCPPSETGDDSDDDSFEVYIKKVKRQIKQNEKQQNNSVRKLLPSQTPQLIMPGYKLDSRACGSTSDLRRKKTFKDPKNNIKSSTGSSSWRDSPVITISSDSESEEVFPSVAVKKKLHEPAQSFVTPRVKGHNKTIPKTEGYCRQVSRKFDLSPGISVTQSLSFLASLSTNVHVGRCHPEAFSYVKNFKRLKEQLSEKLYKYYNTHVFENKLPPQMSIKWNARMTKTAGFCYYQVDRSKPNGRGARIELSTKVIDTPERMRDTLIHELCHAAAWIISGYKAGHGPLWKAWAAKAIHTFPELPPISRCHSYEISCKYTYRCTHCSYSIGRHSKSLDTERKVCGYCHGKFELVLNPKQGGRREIGNGRGSEKSSLNTLTQVPPKTPRTPGVFAMFVKENYGSVKKSGQNLKHADVMKILSAEFGKMKASSN
ncbi:uncharacterized protein [Panulirus ornatus]